MLRIWIMVGIVLVVGLSLGLWISSHFRRKNSSSSASRSRVSSPDDDAEFLRSINIDPESFSGDASGDDK